MSGFDSAIAGRVAACATTSLLIETYATIPHDTWIRMWRLLSILMILAIPRQQPSAELDTVIQRAADYVAKYQEELGNLIGTEEYSQNVMWKSTSGRVTGMIVKREQRRVSSDFLMIEVGHNWEALRKTNRVDGRKVSDVQPDFETVFDDSPQANTKRFNQMKADSTKYNIGDIQREVNLPTFALEVLRPTEVPRFEFLKTGTSKVNGILTWEVRFKELRGWTLVHGRPDQELFSHGTFWIEPETGRVLKTEFMVENNFEQSPIHARVVVTYGSAKNLSVVVPTSMMEHYENQYNSIECRADYSNFRTFEVDVKFDLKPPGGN